MKVSLALISVLIFALIALSGAERQRKGAVEEAELITKRKQVDNCIACDLLVNMLQKHFSAAPYMVLRDVLSKVTEERDFNFFKDIPEYGGAFDFTIFSLLPALEMSFDVELMEDFRVLNPLDFCNYVFLCSKDTLKQSVVYEVDECKDCPEGGCTSWGFCAIDGKGRGRRNFITYSHPLADVLDPEFYSNTLHSKETMDAYYSELEKNQKQPPKLPKIIFGGEQQNQEPEDDDNDSHDDFGEPEGIPQDII